MRWFNLINKVVNLPKHIISLINKIEKAEDFGYDDEEVSLSDYCKNNKLFWCWNDSLFDAEVLITNNKTDVDEMRIKRNLIK